MIKKLFFAVFLLINANLLAQTPVLKDFEIRDSSPNKVYFTAEGDISNLTKQGFIISGKTISSINISEKSFTVSTPFTFWDNNTIRLENGDGTVHDFTLEYISNNIDEPEATANTYYVATDGSDSNDGTSINTPFVTFQKALDVATAGSTIYVKAGTYITTDHTYLENSGTSTAPIKVIGYKADPVILDSSISDITSMYYSFTAGSIAPDLDPSEMPMLDGKNIAKYALHADGDDYYIFKNIQIQRYSAGFNSWDSEGILVENCITKDMYGSGATEGTGIALVERNDDGHDFNPTYFRIKNTIAINGGMANINLAGSHNLVENCKTYCDKRGGSGVYGSDYYIAIMGDKNIVRNSRAEAIDGTVNNSSHGIGARGASKIWTGSGYSIEGAWGSYTSYNLFQNLYIKSNSNQGIQSRNPRSDYNVWKDIEIAGFANGTGQGIVSQTGAQNNIYERIYIYDLASAFQFATGREGSKDPNLLQTSGNIYRNIIVKNVTRVLITTNAYTDVVVSYNNNKFYNITVNNAGHFYHRSSLIGNNYSATGNEFINCIFNNIENELGTNSVPDLQDIASIRYSNFYGGFTKPTWSVNCSSENPELDLNLNITPATPESIYNEGFTIPSVKYDFERKERKNGEYSKGAFDNEVAILGSLGPDVTICNGENTILTASGGSSYAWNNGETTASITVSPTVTTMYTVTISDGTQSDSHDIIVTVNEAPSVNAGSDQTICAGEDITLTASGVGNFLWSTGETTSSITVSPTSTTTYTVTASNSCTGDATDQVIVNVTPGVNLTLGSDVEICLGENITLTAQSNGDFLWNTGETSASITVSPVSTTIYSVTSSLGDCSKSEEVSVTVNQAPSVNVGSDQTICAGENITLTASGVGNFLWSTGETTSTIAVSPTETTTYTVTASNSCSNDATDQVIVTVNDKPTVSVSNDITIENGSSTVLTASGDGNFLWSTGETTSSITVSPSITTTYSVTLTSQQGCSETNSIEVIVTNNSEAIVIADAGPDQDVCLDAIVELTASGGETYLWSTGETTPSINVSPTETTTYTVTVSNGSSIDVDDVIVYVDESCSELNNRLVFQDFKVYPNPTNGILHIELSGYSNELNLSLFNSTGKIIHSDIISNYSLDKSLKRNINLKKFGKGVYYARIVNNGKIETKKVIVM